VVDASSSWGISLVVGKCWSAWCLLAGWHSADRDIGWAESIALELAVMWLIKQSFSNCNVTIRGDNTGMIGAFNKGRSQNTSHNDTIHRMATCLVPFNISISPVYVASSENRADQCLMVHWVLKSFALIAVLCSLQSYHLSCPGLMNLEACMHLHMQHTRMGWFLMQSPPYHSPSHI